MTEMTQSLEEVLRDAYESEINISISSFWDAGWTVKIGNTYSAQVSMVQDIAIENLVRTVVQEAVRAFPKSKFSEKYSPVHNFFER
jgi:hypothetical protein